jgi:hypothetical protein
MSSSRRKREDTAEGCRLLANDDRERATHISNDHMRAIFECSARVWSERANMLGRLEASLDARTALHASAFAEPSVNADLR